ncbi:hypothetical protein F443_20708 [Phytophthora nicotianae P1569]|uniref:Uncharacterized protein n=1 Tax=Phytophthora nicotianae P1569 TaxID=1317065 RepID=V9E063_PHYNI|nr:hypothetical protein F443_20708 [Phytophthora nicotianae P1569]
MIPSPSGEGVVVAQETTRRMLVQRGQTDNKTKQQIHELDRRSAAVHHTVNEQIDQVRKQQSEIAASTSEYLQTRYDQQLKLQKQRKDIEKQMENQRQYLLQQPRRQWAVKSDSLKILQRVSVRILKRGEDFSLDRTKNEKREFMDSYMIYKRRVDALNQGAQTRVFTMLLSACIEQATLIRVCRFEFSKNLAVKPLVMNLELHDTTSRLSRLLADFYQVLDDLNMEDIIHEDLKTVVEYLSNALRSQDLKPSIKEDLARLEYKPVKRDVQKILGWLNPRLE